MKNYKGKARNEQDQDPIVAAWLFILGFAALIAYAVVGSI